MIHRLETINNFLSQSLLWIAGVFLVLMMVLACTNMILRAVWEPIKGTFELMGFAGAVSTAFALAATQRRKGHITINFLSDKLPPLLERALLLLSFIAGIAFFVLVAWQSALWAQSLYTSGEVSETLHIIYYPFAAAVAAGFAALTLTLFTDFCLLFVRNPKEPKL